MPIANYRTRVPTVQTVGEIMGMLASIDARDIQVSYENRHPTAITFAIATEHGLRDFRLPARPDRVQAVLLKQHKTGAVTRSLTTTEHAVTVAWRIIRDWLRAQVALLETSQVEAAEIMLPFLVHEGRTLYETLNVPDVGLTVPTLPALSAGARAETIALPPGRPS